jgi:gas vesicle protein
MSKGSKIVGGMLLGAMFAAGLVLLYAPRSGAETQQLIRERVESILSEGRQAAEMRRLELTAQFDSLKQPGRQA